MGKQLSVKPKQSRSLEAFRRKPSNLLAAVIRRSLLASAGLVLAQPFGSVLASPQGGDVVAGQGTIAQPNANTTIITQQSQNVAIDWQSFNLAQQDLVRFDQPNSSAAALNRILNGSPTQILGTIQSNGKVFLINPRGIIFGNGSRVNVGALFASSLDITNHDFMSGNYKFAAAPGSAPGAIVNQGQIEAAIGGSVTMVGGSASNEGVITATLGQVNLGAGTEAVVDFAGDGLIHFAVSGEAAQQVADAAVANSGAINAGEVTLSARAARSVFDNVINNTGTIKAGRIDRSGGKIRLVGIGGSVRNSGTLDASGTSGGGISVVADGNVDVLGTITADATTGTGGIVSITSGDTTILDSGSHVSAASTDGQGGRVEVLGPQVGLVGDAVVDASGGTGGGTVLVGGELSGGGVTPTSRAVFVGTDATIRADATHNGDGGTVIVWSDEVSRVYGSLSARGGAQGGNGGFVETSSAGFLDVTRAPDINAPLGSGGEWLIDPDDIEIVDAGDDDFSNSADGPNFTFTSNGAVSRLNVSTLVDALSFNATVRVVTNNSNASGLGNITLSADLDYNGIGSSNLILEAINDIVINADITDSDATNDILNLTLSANTDNGSGGGVIIANDVTIDLGGGDFTVGNTADGFAAGNSTIDAGNVSIDVTGSIALGNVNATNNLTAVADGDITQNASTSLDVTNTSSFNTSANIVLTNTANDFRSITLSGDSATIVDNNAIVLAGTTLSNLTVTAGGAANENITQTGALNITNTATLTAANASIVLNNSTNDFNTLSLSASEADIADDNAVVLGASTLSNLTVTAGGMANEDITQSGAVMVSNTATLTAANASIVLNNGTNDFNTLALTTTEANIADDTGIVLAGTTLSNLTVTAGGAANENITQTGALHITNTADLTAANASIVLNNSTNDFNTLSLSASEANIADDNAVVLGASTLSNLTVTAGGMASEDITQSGAVMVSNTATLTAANASIVLNNSTNDFNTLSLSASEANIADDNAVVLGTSTLSNLTVTAGGMANEDITQSGTVMVSNTAILTAANASIVLTTGTNDFNTLSLSASEANVTDTNAVVLGTSDLSNLTVTAGGDITQSGALIIGNTAALTADNADIVLTTPTNDFNIATLVAANATVVDANDINIGGSNLTHNLTVTASSGNIIGTALSVANTATFNATADVILTNTTNDLNNVMIQQAVNVNIVDGVGNLTLQNSTITGTLTANTTAAGSVLAVAAGNTVNVTGMATLTSANSVSVNGTLTSNGANITATGGSFVTGGNSSISTGASNFTVTATDAMLGGANGSITGNNSVLLQPVAANGMVSLGNATGGLNLTAAELLTLNDAFTNVTIGNDGNVTTGGAVVFPEAVITLNSNVILSTGNNSFDVNGTTGSLVVNGGILDNNTTPGSFTSNLTISDAVTVNGNVVADAINLQAINFNTAATLRTDTLTLNGAVTGSNQLALQREILADVDIGGANETFLGAPTISQFGGFAGDLIIGGNDAPTNVSNFTVGNLAVSSPFNTGAGNTTVFSQGNVNFLAGGQISAGTGVNLIALGDGLGVANGDIVDAGDASVAPDGFLNAPNVVAIAFGNISSPTPFTVNATMVAAATGADLSPANTEILDGDIMTALGGGASTDIIDILMALSNNNNLPSGLQAAAQEALVQVQANIVDNASAIPDPNTEIEEIVVIDNSSLETLDQISLIQIEEGTTLPWYMRDDVPLIEESQEVWEEFIESVTQGYPEDRKSVVAEAIRAYYRQGQLEDAIDGGDSSSTDDQLGEDDSRVAPGTPQGALTGDGDEPWATLRYVGMPWLKGGIGVDASNWRHAPLAV